MKWTAWLLCGICWLVAPLHAQAKRVIYTLNVGNNAAPEHHVELSTLRYADDDAVRFYRLLAQSKPRSSLLTAFDADTRRRHGSLVSEASVPSFENLRATLERFRHGMQADKAHGDQPVLFFSFSGHGADTEAGEPALALSDRPLTRALLYGELLPLVSDAEVHIIVDACRASGVIGVRGAFGVEHEGQTGELSASERSQLMEAQSLSRFANVGALVATTVDQNAHEWSRFESGVFSHEILSALRGAADINGDSKLAYSEVEAFVAAANRDIANPKARATVIARAPGEAGGDGVLLELADLANSRLLTGRAQDMGHFFVELENGERLLDAHLAQGQVVALALPQGESAYVRTRAQEARLPAGPEALFFSRLHFSNSSVSQRGSIEASLRDRLWHSDYGPHYYRGFVDSRGLSGVSFQAPQAARADSQGAPPLRRKRLAWASLAVAGAALAVGVTTLGLSLASKHDFEATHREKRAHQLKDQFERRAAASVALGAVALGAGAGAFFLWPRVSKDARGTSASLDAQWWF